MKFIIVISLAFTFATGLGLTVAASHQSPYVVAQES